METSIHHQSSRHCHHCHRNGCFMHFYRILYCFYNFVQWSCRNCDSATL